MRCNYLLILICLLTASPILNAQSLLNNPESVVFDAPRDRYLVSNWGDGNIIQLDAEGNEAYFDTTLTRIAGLYILHDTLYVASSLDDYIGVVGYDLVTDTIAFYIPIEDAGLCNDITADSSGNLYITDFYDHKIYKIREGVRGYTTFVDSGLDMPNGIVYDPPHNRLLVISQNAANGPIFAVNPSDSTLSHVVDTGYYAVDGVELDRDGRFYFSTWHRDRVMRFNPEYTELETVTTGNLDPADLYINPFDNTLCIPNFSRNTVDFIELELDAGPDHSSLPDDFQLNCYPNPFNGMVTVSIELPISTTVSLSVLSIEGRVLEQSHFNTQLDGTLRYPLNLDHLATGMYLLRAEADGRIMEQKLTHLK